MAAIPISQFEHRVAHWGKQLARTREPLEVSQRGVAKLVVLDVETFEQLKADRERLQALAIRILVDAGERAFKRGEFESHEDVGKLLGKKARRPSRRR